ncbi:MAG: cytochrome P450, partial [Gaiellaceae bacterium]
SVQSVEPFAATDPREWKRLMLAAAAEGPMAIDAATGITHLLRHRDIEQILNEPRLRGAGLSLFDQMGITDGPLRDWYGGLMFTNDGSRHDRLRRLVSKAFTPRAAEQLRPIAAALVAERLSPIRAAGGGDLVAALADVPMHVMCAIVGVPAADVPEFITWVDALSPVFLFMEPAQIAAATAAISELLAYARDLLERRSHTPAADLMTSLIRAEHDGDRLTREETIAMVANVLVGGHDTTASQIGCTLLTLLSRPSALADLRSDPSLLPELVNETIRFEPSIAAAPRTVVEPIELCGIEHPAGAVVMCNFLTANRDPAVWHDPDSFVAPRFAEPDAPRLLSFGGGPHYCLGAALARLTLEESVRGVAALAPALTSVADDIEWVQVLGRSPAHLPVVV